MSAFVHTGLGSFFCSSRVLVDLLVSLEARDLKERKETWDRLALKVLMVIRDHLEILVPLVPLGPRVTEDPKESGVCRACVDLLETMVLL